VRERGEVRGSGRAAKICARDETGTIDGAERDATGLRSECKTGGH